VYGSNSFTIYRQWNAHALKHYMASASDHPPAWLTMYYDPLIQFNNTANLALSWLWWSFFLLPNDRERVRLFYETIKANFLVEKDGSAFLQPAPGVGIDDPYLTARALTLAHELADGDTVAKLRAHAEAQYEPTWDRVTGEFYYLFGLKEPFPRGQYNAVLMPAEVGREGAWWRLFNEPNLKKFSDPTVQGVDYPRLGLSQAYYDREKRALFLQTYAATPSAAGSLTRFRVANLQQPEACSVLVDGIPHDRVRVVEGQLEIETTIGEKRYQVIKL
jgi:hypothetical protein